MGSKPATYRLRDLAMAIVGAQRAGLTVVRVEIDKQGKIVIHAGHPPTDAAPCETKEGGNEWDVLLAKGQSD
ncbi:MULTISPECIES: hypothetical protein [Bradyrhizobium]|jgi:hypothetical protein|uniref:Uncharacterized protein n=1 Tax=Bradyrhizobium ottawaense TaxID=931866 RepID=A0ABV4FUK5_9BRAD|nr:MULTISPECIES: hypothetical protein [Bradyrhizobium]MBR1294839.1 hypothetical protein [Bradyrhizobium ottawaense]WLB47298.1 hypothetical protein QIH93_04280 [Bradyrhizobium ottawaense]WQN84621.1 hypothetical protein U7859_09200 [Bradyrhizobium ottawaense]BBO08493.1 hypothetical protein SG09_78430 [Bradyrhizobium ottawaense]GMO42328.1 hypothetical protein BwSF21_54600 [Bradyrhizobium ottawaense]